MFLMCAGNPEALHALDSATQGRHGYASHAKRPTISLSRPLFYAREASDPTSSSVAPTREALGSGILSLRRPE
jgi:hypothetical protein